MIVDHELKKSTISNINVENIGIEQVMPYSIELSQMIGMKQSSDKMNDIELTEHDGL